MGDVRDCLRGGHQGSRNKSSQVGHVRSCLGGRREGSPPWAMLGVKSRSDVRGRLGAPRWMTIGIASVGVYITNFAMQVSIMVS